MIDMLTPPIERETMPTLRHGVIIMRLGTYLTEFATARGLGIVCAPQTTFTVVGSPPTREPDLAVVVRDRVPANLDTEADFAPDLAVEVVSRTDTFGAVAAKVRQYLDSGTRIVWVVRPETRTVEVYHPGSAPTMIASGELAGDPVLPDFRVAVDDIFAV